MRLAASGFTLVELIITLVLIGIIAAVVGPRFFSNNAFSEDQFAQGVLNALRYAPEAAITSGCDVQMTLASNRYSLSTDSNCLTAAPPPALTTGLLSPFDNSTVYAATAPAGLTLSGNPGPLVFAPDGTIHAPAWNSPASVSLTLTVTGTTVNRTFTLYGLSGYVQ